MSSNTVRTHMAQKQINRDQILAIIANTEAWICWRIGGVSILGRGTVIILIWINRGLTPADFASTTWAVKSKLPPIMTNFASEMTPPMKLSHPAANCRRHLSTGPPWPTQVWQKRRCRRPRYSRTWFLFARKWRMMKESIRKRKPVS